MYSLDWVYPWLSKSAFAPITDPFDDFSSRAIPHEFYHALRWCQDIVLRDGIYSSAINKIVSYFVTDIKIERVGDSTRRKYLEYLNDYLDIHTVLKNIGKDYMIYGNSFLSVFKKFMRYANCSKCNANIPLDYYSHSTAVSFNDTEHINAICLNCGNADEKRVIQTDVGGPDSIYIKRWNPFNIIIRYHPITDYTEYIILLDREIKTLSRIDPFFFYKHSPKIFLKAIFEGKDILLKNEILLHLKQDNPSGVFMRGWGLSPVLANMRQSWYLQILRRYNEAMGLDFIIPLRFITPVARQSEFGEPSYNADLGWYQAVLTDMLRWRRVDPTSWFVLPYPVQLVTQEPGNRNFATIQLIENAQATLLNSIGVPAEFYTMNFQIQAAPISLRLMESTFSGLRHILNKALKWIVKKISKELEWEDIDIKLSKPSDIDDLNIKISKLQLMMNGMLSKETGLSAIGIDYEDEQNKMLEEEKKLAEKIALMQNEMSNLEVARQIAPAGTLPKQLMDQQMEQQLMALQAAQQMGLFSGGMSSPGTAYPIAPQQAMGGSTPESVLNSVPEIITGQKIDPQEFMNLAKQVSDQLVQMDSTLRNSTLRKIKQKNVLFYSIVKNFLEEYKRQVSTSAIAQST